MSEKPLTAALKTKTQSARLGPIFFVEADFPAPTGIVRVCTLAGGYFKWDGLQWTGLGGVVSISPVTETTDLRAQSYRIGVNLFDGAWFDPAKLGDYNGRSAKLWIGEFDNSIAEDLAADTDPRLTLDPYLLVDGWLDSEEINEGGADGGTLEFTIIDQLEIINRRSELRYTQEHQNILYPDSGDLGLEFIPSLQDKDLKWGG